MESITRKFNVVVRVTTRGGGSDSDDDDKHPKHTNKDVADADDGDANELTNEDEKEEEEEDNENNAPGNDEEADADDNTVDEHINEDEDEDDDEDEVEDVNNVDPMAPPPNIVLRAARQYLNTYPNTNLFYATVDLNTPLDGNRFRLIVRRTSRDHRFACRRIRAVHTDCIHILFVLQSGPPGRQILIRDEHTVRASVFHGPLPDTCSGSESKWFGNDRNDRNTVLNRINHLL